MKFALCVAAVLLAMTTAAHATGAPAGAGAHSPAGQSGQTQHARPKVHHAH
jgi:hypothetical protein